MGDYMIDWHCRPQPVLNNHRYHIKQIWYRTYNRRNCRENESLYKCSRSVTGVDICVSAIKLLILVSCNSAVRRWDTSSLESRQIIYVMPQILKNLGHKPGNKASTYKGFSKLYHKHIYISSLLATFEQFSPHCSRRKEKRCSSEQSGSAINDSRQVR